MDVRNAEISLREPNKKMKPVNYHSQQKKPKTQKTHLLKIYLQHIKEWMSNR